MLRLKQLINLAFVLEDCRKLTSNRKVALIVYRRIGGYLVISFALLSKSVLAVEIQPFLWVTFFKI